MISTIDLDAILALPVSERIALAQSILESLANEDENRSSTLSPADKAELLRRRDAHHANPSEAIPWEVVRAELKARRTTG